MAKKRQSEFGFKFMAFGFKLRDLFKPRGRILGEVGIEPGNRVLDFGCGPGGYIPPLAGLVGASGEIIALDVNRLALRSVENLAFKNHLKNVRTVRSGLKTGLPDASVDVILLYDVLHHLSKLEAVLDELSRVLKPEGLLSVSDHHLSENEIVSRITATKKLMLAKRGKSVYNFMVQKKWSPN